ncbi:hypothetical protein ACN47E_007869 [Coniothyrium glycines]
MQQQFLDAIATMHTQGERRLPAGNLRRESPQWSRGATANNRVFVAYASKGSLLTLNGHACKISMENGLARHNTCALQRQVSRRRKRRRAGKPMTPRRLVGRITPQGVGGVVMVGL